MNNFINNQNWRYATKKFDATKKISVADLELLKESIQLASSSYGLQPYKVLIIENKEIREQLLPVSWNQRQIIDASHLFVFVNYTNLTEEYINNYINHVSNTRNIPLENIAGYGEFMKSKVLINDQDSLKNWTAKQTYLALGNLLNAAAELKIDVTPMEGFESDKYNTILGLEERNLNAVLVAPIGYRHEEDATQHLAKVRKPENLLFEIIK